MTENHKSKTTDPLSGIIAQLRRLYLHLLREGPITPDDLSRMIARLEEYQNSQNKAPLPHIG